MQELDAVQAGLRGMVPLLDMTPLTQVTGLYALMTGLIALQWLLRVAREARLGYLPRVAWWAVPGLGLLLLTPPLEVPALFGLGAALLLLAEFWPFSYQRGKTRPRPAWPLVLVLIGAALAFSILQNENSEPVAFVFALCALLAGAAGLLGVTLFPAAPAQKRQPLNFQTRWHHTQTPQWPDLSVTLSEQGAHLKNISPRAVRLAGWSPAGINAWYQVRGSDGKVLAELRAGQEALLPVGERDSGIRVWYGPDQATAQAASQTQEAYLFRADWTPTARAAQRVLN